jgi:hypothetical protein
LVLEIISKGKKAKDLGSRSLEAARMSKLDLLARRLA